MADDGIVVARSGTWIATSMVEEHRMAARSLTERVEILEQRVGLLEQLPDRVTAVESQILQLRGELGDEFSAIRQRFDAVDTRFDALERRMREGDDETRHLMRVLHEDVIARISQLQEGRGKK